MNAQNLSPKEQMLAADRRYMATLLQASRAKYAAMPQTQKDQMARFMEDEYFASLPA